MEVIVPIVERELNGKEEEWKIRNNIEKKQKQMYFLKRWEME